MTAHELAKLDLNLLVDLHALLEERHVTRAAARLGRSQPAISRALARLREQFGDPLLVRTGGALTLTERAEALLPRVIELLRAVEDITRADRFVAATARGVFRIAAPDIVSLMIVPPLLALLRARAPGVDLSIEPWQPGFRQHLTQGEIDLTVGFPKGDEADVYARSLFEQDWAVVLRRGHPALRKRWTPALFASLEHALVSVAVRGTSQVDEALAALDHQRRVAVRVPYPLLAPMLVAGSDLVVTTVRWLAVTLEERGGVVVRRPPVPLPRVRVPMVWHERTQNDERQRWFRDQVSEAAASLDPSRLRW